MTRGHLRDVAVVGGGPAGATAAFLMARDGFRVTLFDRQDFPRPKLCAGLLTRKTIRLLESIFGVGAETLRQQGIVVQTCRNYRVMYHQSELARGRLAYPFHLVDRARYDHFWTQKARQAGVRLQLGRSVTHADPSGRMVTEDGAAHQFDVIIGADGVSSRLRRGLFASRAERRHWRSRLAGTLEVRPSATPHDACATLYFGYAPWGYAWSFPNPGSMVTGMCALHRRGEAPLKAAFERFLMESGAHGTARTEWQSHPLPYGNFLARPGQGRLLLIGDACGLADPLLGEGIFYAHRSAQIAARAVAQTQHHPQRLAEHYAGVLNRAVLYEFRWMAVYRGLLFAGGRMRRFRGLRLLLRLFPARLEALVQGTRSFARLLLP